MTFRAVVEEGLRARGFDVARAPGLGPDHWSCRATPLGVLAVEEVGSQGVYLRFLDPAAALAGLPTARERLNPHTGGWNWFAVRPDDDQAGRVFMQALDQVLALRGV